MMTFNQIQTHCVKIREANRDKIEQHKGFVKRLLEANGIATGLVRDLEDSKYFDFYQQLRKLEDNAGFTLPSLQPKNQKKQ